MNFFPDPFTIYCYSVDPFVFFPEQIPPPVSNFTNPEQNNKELINPQTTRQRTIEVKEEVPSPVNSEEKNQQLIQEKMIQKPCIKKKFIKKKKKIDTDSQVSQQRLLRQEKKKQTKLRWTAETDNKIIKYVEQFGYKWKQISHILVKWTPKQIRERYCNSLRKNINNKPWTVEQDQLICKLVKQQGRKWKSFQKDLIGRTESQIKGRFYGKLNPSKSQLSESEDENNQ